MKKLVLWLMLLGLLCPLPGTGLEGSDEATVWVTRDGVVYQLEEDHYVPIHFLKGQEVLAIPRALDGLPVRLVEQGEAWDTVFTTDALFTANDARELHIDAAETVLDSLYLMEWPNLRRFSLTSPAWDIGYLSLYRCPRLMDFHTENQSQEAWGTFYLVDCPALTTLTVPVGTHEIYGPLTGCDSLRTLVVPEDCGLYDDEPFNPKTPLERISCPGEDPETADGVWYKGEELYLYPSHRPGKEYAVREGTTWISWNALSSLQYLETLRLPASLQSVSDWMDVSLLSAIEVDEENPWLRSVDGVVYSKDGATLMSFPGQKATTYETLPGTVEIGEAFRGNPRLETLRLSEGLVTLDDWSLARMGALREVYLPASLERVDSRCFAGCSALEAIYVAPENPCYKSVDGVLFTVADELVVYPGGRGGHYDLPAGATVAVDNAFAYAGALESLLLPASVDNLEELSLSSCASLRRVEVTADHPAYTSIDGVVFSKDKKRLVLYPQGHGDAYDVPVGTEVIGANAFGGNSALRSISFPHSVRVIGKNAFAICTALTSVVLPLTLEEIGDSAFSECLALEKMVIPQDVRRIGADILWNCPELRELQGPGEIVGVVRLMGKASPEEPRYGFVRAEAGASLLREGKEGAAVLGRYPQGTGCTVWSAPNAPYARVEIGEAQGYLLLADIEILPSMASYDSDSGTGRVRAGTPVYQAPATTSAVLATLGDEDVALLSLRGPWCAIGTEEEGVTGYIETRMLEGLSVSRDDIFYADGIRLLQCASPLEPAMLRDAPTEKAAEIGRLYTGALVRVKGTSETDAFVCTAAGDRGFLRLADTMPVEIY